MNRWLSASLVLTALAFAASLTAYFGYRDWMLESIPVHWGVSGEPDAWVHRDDSLVQLILMPGVMLLMVLLSLALPYLSPVEYRVERFGSTYWYIMFLVTALMAWIQFTIMLAAFGSDWPIARLLVAGICAMFALMGNVMGRVKRNFWVGIRTPWTLASEVVWNQTHRLAAWLFVGFGVAGCVVALSGLPLMWTFAFLLPPGLVPVIYSLVLYKRLERAGRL